MKYQLLLAINFHIAIHKNQQKLSMCRILLPIHMSMSICSNNGLVLATKKKKMVAEITNCCIACTMYIVHINIWYY